MPLFDLRIRNLKPADKPYKRWDFDGLFILVNPRGSKLWRFKYRFRDKEKLISFGAYPSVSLLQARKLRDFAREQLAAGIDPSEQRQEEKAVVRLNAENSFESVSEGYVNKINRRDVPRSL